MLFEKRVDVQFHSCIAIATRTRLSIAVLLVLPLIGIRGNYSGYVLILFAFAMMNASINSEITLCTKALTREACLAARP